MAKIKICGLKRIQDIEYVNQAKPDYAGFVFAPSKRQVSKEQARQLIHQLSSEIQSVGVFVNETEQEILDIVQVTGLDLVQLHGDESEDFIIHLKEKLPKTVSIIKAIRVRDATDLARGNDCIADYVLFDAYSKDGYGGTGHAFDWNWIQQLNKPFFLAGGINLDNMDEALQVVRPYGVDLSSSVETDGYKDREKIIEIVNKVKAGR